MNCVRHCDPSKYLGSGRPDLINQKTAQFMPVFSGALDNPDRGAVMDMQQANWLILGRHDEQGGDAELTEH